VALHLGQSLADGLGLFRGSESPFRADGCELVEAVLFLQCPGGLLGLVFALPAVPFGALVADHAGHEVDVVVAVLTQPVTDGNPPGRGLSAVFSEVHVLHEVVGDGAPLLVGELAFLCGQAQ
jgi:hypothetical protein